MKLSGMTNTFALIILALSCTAELLAVQDSVVQDSAVEEKSKWNIYFAPNLGGTFLNISKSTEETENFQWLASVQAKIDYEGETFQWNNSLFAQYGQFNESKKLPIRTQDNVILTTRPSIELPILVSLRLFLETTAETAMGRGAIPETDMSYLDPLFLYQTLFIGKKITDDGDSYHFDMSYGAGYSFQQTFTNKYVLAQNRNFVLGENNPLSSVQEQATLESGIAAICDLNFRKNISESMTWMLGARVVAMGKKDIQSSIENSRVSSLVTSSLNYKIFSLDYINRIVYDRNLSPRRQLEQSLTIGIKFRF